MSSLQLWLTTSITISSQDESTNLQQLTPAQVLEYLLSGSCWVCRGNGLHLSLELTVQGDPLVDEEKQQLATSIVNAPVWKQLHLLGSIPEIEMDVSLRNTDGKYVRINIDHLRTEELPRSKLHRIGRNVPFADVKPPAGIPVINLLSVAMEMAILRNNTKPNAKKQKVDNSKKRQSLSDATPSDIATIEAPVTTHTKYGQNTVPSTMEASKILTELLTTRGEKRKLSTNTLTKNDAGSSRISQEDMCEISKCIDGALRISACKGAVKLPQGIKLLANTFMGTLSEICPAVWRLQYLPVYAVCVT
jgi:hypothetical protein